MRLAIRVNPCYRVPTVIGAFYLLLSVLLITCLSALGYMPQEAPWASPSLYVACGLGAASWWLLRRELRRDPDQLCVYWVFFGAIVALGSLMLLFEHRILGACLTIVSCLSWVTAVVWLIWSHFAKDPRSTELRRRLGSSEIYEQAGVQLGLDVLETQDAYRGVFEVQIFLQNCWDGERRVTVELHPRRGFLGHPGGALVAMPTAPLVLRGEELGILSVPVQATSEQKVSLQVTLRTSGLGGKRVWRHRAPTIPMAIAPQLTLLIGLATLGTFWAWGGGLFVRVPAGPRAPQEAPLGAQRWRSLGSA